MSPIIATTLHALAAASPIAHNAVLSQENVVSLATILPNGIAPVNMAQVTNPAAEAEKCNLGLYLNCTDTGGKDCAMLLRESDDCKLAELIGNVIGNLPPSVNVNAPISVVDNANVERIDPEANEARDASAPAHALERRQSHRCPNHRAGWAAMPPRGTWFALCLADCYGRCKDGGKWP